MISISNRYATGKQGDKEEVSSNTNDREFVDKLDRAKKFSLLDLKSAYHQVELHEESRDITTFMTPLGAMRFTRLAFGMNAAPEIFQQIMDEILGDCEGCVVYIDDVLIYAENVETLKQRTAKVMEKLKGNNLVINKEKCVYEKDSVEFLGFQINEKGILPTKEKLEIIRKF
ncbi:hypothetical protein PVAND_013950 [Polypedilum vanderplanki]|uniref:Reverse transcriptase domain-containing protein n=1 Tax=Polypedilum vanderplanki TaxID=319348 RepID=A0A9J6CS23_POLVA|nr:hypothetical protein PVAND_013950 [Polypedilum vanderplanki]